MPAELVRSVLTDPTLAATTSKALCRGDAEFTWTRQGEKQLGRVVAQEGSYDVVICIIYKYIMYDIQF